MKEKLICFILCSFVSSLPAAESKNDNEYELGTSYLINTLQDQYAYLGEKDTDFVCVRSTYLKKARRIESRKAAVILLENLLNEFYDNHLTLNTNTDNSYRLNAPFFIELIDDYFIVKDVWGNQIENLGINVLGAKVMSFNGLEMSRLIDEFPTHCANKSAYDVQQWIGNKIIAGRYDQPRVLELQLVDGQITFIDLDALNVKSNKELLQSHTLMNNIRVIRISDSLGNGSLINAFDLEINEISKSESEISGLILDLRNTRSGGSTYVARGIMGRFIDKQLPYQKHSFNEKHGSGSPSIKRSWLELVSPRGTHFSKPLVVLVNHWTGSMGEGLAIGLDGMDRAVVMGTKMAGLAGAVYSYDFDHLGFGFQMPAEKLFHVNGTPRESFSPNNLAPLADNTKDELMERALSVLRKN